MKRWVSFSGTEHTTFTLDEMADVLDLSEEAEKAFDMINMEE